MPSGKMYYKIYPRISINEKIELRNPQYTVVKKRLSV